MWAAGGKSRFLTAASHRFGMTRVVVWSEWDVATQGALTLRGGSIRLLRKKECWQENARLRLVHQRLVHQRPVRQRLLDERKPCGRWEFR